MVMIKKKVGAVSPKVSEPKEEKSIISLPSELSDVLNNLGDYNQLIYGEKKIGKSSLANEYPFNFMMMTEPGGKALRAYQRPVTKWEDFREYVKLLKKDKKFKTVTVDTIDRLYKLCQKYVCNKMGMEHPSDEEWGKGWEAVRDEFTYWLDELLSLNKGVILISHATEKEIKTRAGGKYHKILPTMPGQARDILEAVVDIWAYYNYDNGKRVLVIEGDDHIGAGHRLSHKFKTRSGERVLEIPMGSNPKEAYQNLVDAFDNKFTHPKGLTTAATKFVVKKGGK